VGEYAIAGLLGACTAGVPSNNTPAKDQVRGQMPPQGRRGGEEEESILRLKEGAEGEGSDEDSDLPSVHEGQLIAGGNPLQEVSIQPTVKVERINVCPQGNERERQK